MSANKTIARADADVSLVAGSPATPAFGGERSEQSTDAIAKALRKVYVDGAAAMDPEPGAAGQATPPMKDRDHMILHRELNKVLRNIQTERGVLQRGDGAETSWQGDGFILVTTVFLMLGAIPVSDDYYAGHLIATILVLLIALALAGSFLKRYVCNAELKYILLNSGTAWMIALQGVGLLFAQILAPLENEGVVSWWIGFCRHLCLFLMHMFVIALDACDCGKSFRMRFTAFFLFGCACVWIIAFMRDDTSNVLFEGYNLTVPPDDTASGNEETYLVGEYKVTTVVRLCCLCSLSFVVPAFVKAVKDRHGATTYITTQLLFKGDIFPAQQAAPCARVGETVQQFQAALQERLEVLSPDQGRDLIVTLVYLVRADNHLLVPHARGMDLSGWLLVLICFAFFIMLLPGTGNATKIPTGIDLWSTCTRSGPPCILLVRDVIWLCMVIIWCMSMYWFLRTHLNMGRLHFVIRCVEIHVLWIYTGVQTILFFSVPAWWAGYWLTFRLMQLLGFSGAIFITLLDACDCSMKFRQRFYFGACFVTSLAFVNTSFTFRTECKSSITCRL